MKLYKNGSVGLSRSDVADFARAWPCFGDIKPLWFEFDKHGDLVDMSDCEGCDDSGILALSHDAQAWAGYRLQAGRNGKKIVSVDYYPPNSTQADFRYQGRLVAELPYPDDSDISDKLARLRDYEGFTHWRSVQTGKIQLITGGAK